MKIKVDSVSLKAALRNISKIAQPELINLEFKGSILTLHGHGPASSCMMRIPLHAPVEKEDEFEVTVGISTLLGVLGKRTDLTVGLEGTALSITADRYVTTVLTMETSVIEVVPPDVLEGTDGIVLKSKFMGELLKVLPALELRPLLSTYSEVPVGVRATKNGTFVACFDFIQSASVHMPDLQGDFEFMLPSISQFTIMAKALSSQKYKMVITDTTLYAWNKNFQVSLSLPQQDGEQVLLGDLITLMDEVEGVKFKSLNLDTKEVQEFIADSRAFYDKDSLFEVVADGKVAVLKLTGTVGDARFRAKLEKPVKNTVSFKCDLTFFAAIVGKSKETTIKLKVSENLMRLKLGPISYLMSLV